MSTDAFIAKWRGVTASELSTSQSFLIDLCALLEVDAPHATVEQNYMFERPITFAHGDGSQSAGRFDPYRRGAFVLESKKVRGSAQGRGFDEALLRARSQAEGYARALPASEGRPPYARIARLWIDAGIASRRHKSIFPYFQSFVLPNISVGDSFSNHGT